MSIDSDKDLEEAMKRLGARFAERVPGVKTESVRLLAAIEACATADACEEELEALLRQVHSLVGTGRQFGFNDLADVAVGAERAVYELKHTDAGSWSGQLKIVREKIQALLDFEVTLPG